MIRTLLIANRGEIAGRIISTCKRLGIRTVAIYSEADADTLHVRLADEAVLLGPAPPSESYLNIEAILKAAELTKADAIHPGYGFLAENPEFARQVRSSGFIFVGPSPDVISKMGSKVAAREICQKAGVPVVPGCRALDDEALLAWADDHGYPVMLKASAGGGGKGMRRLADRQSLVDAMGSAKREALKAFGSDEVYLEKALVKPRHLEVQVVGDHHGNVLHLGVRECSLQRRHQKIMEESPPPNCSPQLFEALTSAAVRLATSVEYANLGTVEFLVDGEQFYFLEMNTRLQVEHPVTEMITGLDLVEWQIRIAEGDELPTTQDQISFRGHAMEARLTCEDPGAGFLPATGPVLTWLPYGRVRYDACLETGAEITPHYDSMVCKVIAWSETRRTAALKLETALRSTVLLGVKHNLDFLVELLRHPEVEKGRQHTELVESLEWKQPDVTLGQLLVAAASRWLAETGGEGDNLGGFPLDYNFEGQPTVTVDGTRYSVKEQVYTMKLLPGSVVVDGHRFPINSAQDGEQWWVHTPDGTAVLKALPRLPVPQSSSSGGSLKAPMPGNVVEILVEVGNQVSQGQALLKMEAMKMEQVISAPYDGEVGEIFFAVGEQAEAGAILLEVIERQK